MATVALLSAHHGIEGGPPWGVLAVGGLSIIERQMRQAMSAGATRGIVKVDNDSPIPPAVFDHLGPDVTFVFDGTALAEAVGEDDVLLFAEGAIIDDRIVTQLAALDGAALAVWGDVAPPHAERIDHATCWAGLARIPATVATGAAIALGDWDMQSTLLRAVAALAPVQVEIADIDLYVPDRRRIVPLLWFAVRTPQDAEHASAAMLAATEVGGLGWVARYLHEPMANLLTHWLLPTRVSPLVVRSLSSAIGVSAGLTVIAGWLVTGLILAAIVGFLMRTADKLGRIRVELMTWQDRWDVIDRVIEGAWFLCLGSWLARGPGGASPWLFAAIVILFTYATELQHRFFNQFSGRPLGNSGPLEQRLALIAGDRLTLIWTLIPFAWFGQWLQGLAILAIYAGVTFFVTQARLFQRLGEVKLLLGR